MTIQDQSPPDEVLASISASPARRIFGVAGVGFLGVLLIYLGLFLQPSFAWRLFLVVFGIGALWFAWRMYHGTTSTIELTSELLRDTDGTVIARIADVIAIDRGMLAFKPSNGFLLKTTTAGSRVWRPGLWWRTGKRIGIGGMTPRHQAKNMSEIIMVILTQRDG